ncbi:NELFA family protein [Megaselia abdita]
MASLPSRERETSLWLHNKLGTASSDSWLSSSICSQLNKEVLRNIKDCFSDLQTQVKLKLLLSFFHIPRRCVDEWKTELEEVIEVAGLDSELWVSMLAETMKTFPSTGSLNTEISDYEETRPIFTDMVNDLKKLVNKHSDLSMLPLECLYLNKNALVSVVGQQLSPVKHFTLKRKPKSTTLRAELLQKSADAQSSLKKTTAPTIPLRSRGMPRKMTDTTPLKGIPSRVPMSGFRSPNAAQNPSRPNLIRTPSGRKDGGIKIIELSEQPLGFAAAKKRKRQQELEEQQKKAEQKQQSTINPSNSLSINNSATTSSEVSTIVTDYSPSVYSTAIIKEEIQDEKPQTDGLSESPIITSSIPVSTESIINSNKKFIKEEPFIIAKKENDDMDESAIELNSANLQFNTKQIKSEKVTSAVLKSSDSAKIMTTITSEKIKQQSNEQRTDPLINLPNNISVKITPTKIQTPSQNQSISNSAPSLILKQKHTSVKTVPISNQIKVGAGTGGPVIISQTIIQPATSKNVNTSSSSGFVLPSNASIIRTTTADGQPKIILAHSSQSNTVPSLTSISQQSPSQTKIILKTSSGGLQPLVVTSRTQTAGNNQVNQPPPLISTNLGNRAVTIQPASQAAQQQHLLLQQQQQKQQEQNFTQVVMTSATNNSSSKGKTLYIPQKGIVLQNIGGDMYKQIPISNVSNLQTLTSTSSNPPSLVQSLSTSANKQQQQIPALIPSSNLPVVIQQQPQAVQTIISTPQQQTTLIRPMLTTNVQGNVTSLPQGLTLIQRPGQQPQLVQLQRPQTQMQRIITNPQQQARPQIILQQKPQTIITQQSNQQPTQQIIQVQQPAQQQPQRMHRKGVAIPVSKFNLRVKNKTKTS